MAILKPVERNQDRNIQAKYPCSNFFKFVNKEKETIIKWPPPK